ncbi:Cytochrome P450 89A2 [Apostasia shenzhenica]|uniref:Cytochrome P450 89A2 n=1 Tax=Apostasia shenzhenica TaxID=1088818 RepID=A0A2I0BEU6_9ASPA|nr:Cytochrome P450 89A2 [Apostasia shenzhenica]
MEPWLSSLLLLLLLSLPLSFILARRRSKTSHPPLPPSQSPLPVLAHLILQRRSFFEIVHLIRRFHDTHGPIFSLSLLPGARPDVFISDASLAHAALIHHGAAFADRPLPREPNIFLTCGSRDISSSPYGPLWRLLRRNLSAQILHPTRIRLFAPARSSVLRLLLDKLRSESAGGGGRAVVLKDIFRQTMFCLLVLICFGEKLGESEIREIELPLEFLLRTFTSFNVFGVLPAATKVLFRRRWEKIVGARRRQAEVFLPLIRARQGRMENRGTGGGPGSLDYCYVDSLLELRLPDEGGRGLTDDEMVQLCHEFLTGGVDTTATLLEWTMAELVKHQDLQSKLLSEINSVVGGEDEIKEDDLERMPYLKAVVMEALRRHPPGHYVLPHAVAEDVVLNGYLIPAKTEVHVAVADVNWDERKWEDPMEFRPARFLAGGEGEGVDITGSREIKMMPFGAGRRMCPGYGLAMLHMEFFVANLVREFEWSVEEGEVVDMSETLEFTTVMKNPLQSQVIPRRKIEEVDTRDCNNIGVAFR